MVFSKDPEDINIKMDYNALKQVPKFRYLGSIFTEDGKNKEDVLQRINLLAPELFFLILAHSVYKIWIIQEPNKLELWDKLHFKENKTESIHHV